MNFIDRLVLDHVMHSPSAILATAAVLRYADLGILYLFKLGVTPKEADSVIDGVAAALKARVDADAAKPPTP